MPEVVFEHPADVLGVGEIQRRVHLIQDVDGSRFEQQQGEDERESHQRSGSWHVLFGKKLKNFNNTIASSECKIF